MTFHVDFCGIVTHTLLRAWPARAVDRFRHKMCHSLLLLFIAPIPFHAMQPHRANVVICAVAAYDLAYR